MQLEGRVAVVTGASRGIGREAATALHRRGAAVGLLARSEDELRSLAASLGTRVAWVTADIGDAGQVEAAIARLTDELGPVDVLVNNAGIGAYASVLEEDPRTYERLMRANYFGTVHATRAVLPSMAARRTGHIVNVASVAGRLGAPFEAAYSASKFAVVGFSESLSAEVQGFGISVSLVNPGPVATHFTDARGVPFQRSTPKPLAATAVADAIVTAVEHRRFEQILPRWLGVGVIARAVAPGLYHRGLRRDARAEAAALVARWGSGPGGSSGA